VREKFQQNFVEILFVDASYLTSYNISKNYIINHIITCQDY